MAQSEQNIKAGVSSVWVARGILEKLASFLLDLVEGITTEGKTAGKKIKNVFSDGETDPKLLSFLHNRK